MIPNTYVTGVVLQVLSSGGISQYNTWTKLKPFLE